MSNTLYQPLPETEADCAAETERIFAEIERLNEAMAREQAEMHRLRAECDVLREEGTRLDAIARERMAAALGSLERLRLAS